MKAVIEKEVEIINDLIRINNDRVEGYRKATKELKPTDMDLQQLFAKMQMESEACIRELRAEHPDAQEEVQDETTNKGKLYRAWMDVKATFTGHDRGSILSACEFGEDAAQKAYESALDLEEPISPELANLLLKQKATLRRSHDQIKSLRDKSL